MGVEIRRPNWILLAPLHKNFKSTWDDGGSGGKEVRPVMNPEVRQTPLSGPVAPPLSFSKEKAEVHF